MEYHFSPFISADRISLSIEHVLIRLLKDRRNKLDNNNVVDAILTNLSKAFDCIPHDLLVTKLDAYGFNRHTIAYIYSYLKNRKKCVRINGTQSYLGDIISDIPQGSILSPILYYLFLKDLFYFILLATVHNFADDNTLTYIGKTILELIGSLESECEVALNFFNENKMIVNPHTNEISKIGSKEIKVTSQVKLLGVEIDDKLNFGQHINCICKSPGNQLNALIRLKRFLGFQDKKVLVNSFVLSNFNYCTLVWMFANSKSLSIIENLPKRALRFMLEDYSSSYEKSWQNPVNFPWTLRENISSALRDIKL